MTNLLIAVPGLLLIVMGFPFEGIVVTLCAATSCIWHATGWNGMAIADDLFAVLSFLALLMSFLRVVQVRGWPEFSAFYLTIPFAGLLAFAGSGVLASKNVSPETAFITDRIAHTLWHVLVASTFFLILSEIQRVPGLLPNRALREAIRARDEKMRRRLWRIHGENGSPYISLAYGLVRDLVAGPTKLK
jgi:hypothetical protein